MKTIRIIAAAAAAGLLLAACSSSSSSSSATSGSTSTSTSSSTSAPPTANTQFEVTAPVGASNSGFQETELVAPADTDLEILFINEDAGIPHNIQIFEGTSTTGTPIWAPDGNELITGVAEATYEIPGLPAGTYTFNCFSHPATMVGTLTVE
ncbi:MAG TPA: cupredoxin domain-containing protein [Actinomycetota bacterium]|nr:cupredoxin domain-containing protein [Actinomycetota bacterium]